MIAAAKVVRDDLGVEGEAPPRPTLSSVHGPASPPSAASNSAVAASSKSGDSVDLSKITLLSGQGGQYELPAEHREFMCFTSDGTLHISEAHKTSPIVLGYRDKLQRKDVKYKLRMAPHSAIAGLYKRFSTAPAVDEQSARQAEVVRIMKDAADAGTSDIHFRIEKDATRVFFRIDGVLIERPQLGREHGQTLVSTIYQSMCDVAQAMFMPTKAQDARLSTKNTAELGLKGARMSTRPTDSGMVAVLRLLYQSKQKRSLEELGFLPAQTADVREISTRTSGICIVSGPTGSGKSTTLESLLSSVMREAEYKKNLVTIEDPPEYEIDGAVQTPVQYPSDATDEEISGAWARAISNLMRLDPDLAMIGEVRDLASSIAALRAAMTGHGVYTTLHANDVVAALIRLKDMGVDMGLLTDPKIIIGLISQRLAPRLCQGCRKPFRQFSHLLTPAIAKKVEDLCDADAVYVAGEGCASCGGRSVKGRIVVAETLIPTAGFMREFSTAGQLAARRYWVERMGGVTRNQVLLRRINEGIIDPAHAEEAVCALDEDNTTLE